MTKLIAVWTTVALLAMMVSLTGCGASEVFYKAPVCSVVASATGSTINCPDGTSTFVANGSAGSQGLVGATGPQGPQGSPGSTIQSVQFCDASFVPSYPSTFPELGLCIDGHLYAVYSANNGFLVELMPGAYNSQGLNAGCTFTVANGCQITY